MYVVKRYVCPINICHYIEFLLPELKLKIYNNDCII